MGKTKAATKLTALRKTPKSRGNSGPPGDRQKDSKSKRRLAFWQEAKQATRAAGQDQPDNELRARFDPPSVIQ
jgi:hypothetical protein